MPPASVVSLWLHPRCSVPPTRGPAARHPPALREALTCALALPTPSPLEALWEAGCGCCFLGGGFLLHIRPRLSLSREPWPPAATGAHLDPLPPWLSQQQRPGHRGSDSQGPWTPTQRCRLHPHSRRSVRPGGTASPVDGEKARGFQTGPHPPTRRGLPTRKETALLGQILDFDLRTWSCWGRPFLGGRPGHYGVFGSIWPLPPRCQEHLPCDNQKCCRHFQMPWAHPRDLRPPGGELGAATNPRDKEGSGCHASGIFWTVYDPSVYFLKPELDSLRQEGGSLKK